MDRQSDIDQDRFSITKIWNHRRLRIGLFAIGACIILYFAVMAPQFLPPPTYRLTPTKYPTASPTSIPNLTATQQSWIKPDRNPNLGDVEEIQIARRNPRIPSLDYSSHPSTKIPEIIHPGDLYIFNVETWVDSKQFWQYAWCARNQEILDENIQHIQIEFIMNGSSIPIDTIFIEQLHPFGDIDICQYYIILIKSWPEGQHQLETKITFSQPLNDGWNSYSAGTYMLKYFITARVNPYAHPTLRPSPTPNLTATQQTWLQPVGNPVLGNSDEIQNAVNEPTDEIWLTLEDYSRPPIIMPDALRSGEFYVFNITAKSSQKALWKYEWCVRSQQILDENISNIQVELTLNGSAVPENYILIYQSDSRYSVCQNYVILIKSWTEGQHHLETQITFSQSVTDGWVTYSPRTFKFLYFVTVNLSP